MRAIPTALQAKLDSGATTLCRCWLITRRDGIVQGFTDHDETVLLAGTPCLADTGLNASEATERLGMQIDGAELSGALVHDSLTEADLAAGRYDAATVETWLVDWSDPNLRVLLATGVLGEVRREARPSPPRCARSPIVSIRKAAGSIPPPARPISAMRAAGSILRSRSFAAWAPGDAFVVTAGCDKLLATCRDRFNNVANFRGFPHIPGNDFVMSYPSPGKPGNDGASFGGEVGHG